MYKPQQQSLWVFLQPFETGVWLLMFGATVVVALSIMALEYSWRRQTPEGGAKAGIWDFWTR